MKAKLYKFLRWSEKYTKTDMIYLFESGFWLTFGQIITMIFGLALAIGFANLVSKEVYGNYKFILALAGILSIFTLSGIGTAITQAVARGFEGTLKVGFSSLLKWSFLITTVSLSISLYYFINNNNTLALSLLIIGIFSPLLKSTSLYGSFLEGKKDFKTNALYGVLRNTIPIVATFITILFTQNIVIIIFVYFFSNTAISSILYIRTLTKYKLTKKIDFRFLSYGKHLSLINIIAIIGFHIDKILIFHYLGAIELAVYGFALLIPTQINGLLKNISVLALPKFSEQHKFLLKNALFNKTVKLFSASLFITIIYIIAAPIIFKLLLPQYLDSILYSQIFSINILLTGSILVGTTFLRSQKLVKENYITSVIPNVVRIILMLLLILPYGIFGIIASILISRLIAVLLAFFFIRNHNS